MYFHTVFSDNSQVIRQYHQIRHKAFREELGLSDYCGYEDEFDSRGFTIVAINNEGECIGGARLDYSLELHPQPLPIEGAGLDIYCSRNLGAPRNICQITNLAVRRGETHRGKIAEEIIHLGIEAGEAVGCELLLSYAPPVHTRYYKRIFKKIGFDLVTIDGINVPSQDVYGDLSLSLSSCNITLCSSSKELKSAC
jgi:hypothetical protein